MKLECLRIQNFRCFDRLVVRFDPKLTVIVAENGAGKTSILDAIAVGFGRFLTKLPGAPGLTARETDIRIDQRERRMSFMALSWEATTKEGDNLVWGGVRKRDGAIKTEDILKALDPSFSDAIKKGMKQIDAYALRLVQADADQVAYFLPVIAYYGTNRAIRDEIQRRRGFKKQFSRFEALAGALQPDSRFRAAFEWFNAMEDLELREKANRLDFDYRLPELNAVRSAIVHMLPPGFSNPRTEIRPLRFVIDRKLPDGVTRTLRLSQLSDGFRMILGLVMDLARRMAQANSRLVADGYPITNPLDLPAIVLIDEVDLHLHPKWQQTVLTDLMHAFKGAQFIVTTHSPQVLSTVRRENVLVIGVDSEGNAIAEHPLAMTYGEPSGDVMHSVMMVDQQPPVEEKEDLQRLTELVDQGAYATEDAQRLMGALIDKLGEQNSQLQRLQRSIRRQKALQR